MSRYTIKNSFGKVADLAEGKLENRIIVFPDYKSPNQKWVLDESQGGSYYRIWTNSAEGGVAFARPEGLVDGVSTIIGGSHDPGAIWYVNKLEESGLYTIGINNPDRSYYIFWTTEMNANVPIILKRALKGTVVGDEQKWSITLPTTS